MDWQTIIFFSVVFHATGHLLNHVKAYQEKRSVARMLRELSMLDERLEKHKFKRVK